MRIDIAKPLLFAYLVVVALAGYAHGGFPVETPTDEGRPGLRSKGGNPAFVDSNSQRAKGPKFREDSILVKFRPAAAEGEKERLHNKHGSQVAKDFPRLRLQKVKLKKGVTVEAAVASYRTDPNVEYAEPDYAVEAMATPDDDHYYYAQLWGMAAIDAPSAWDITTGSAEIVVAVIDTGVESTHPDLSANMWINSGEIPGNGLDDDGNGYIDDVHGINAIDGSGNSEDDRGHGTHVAGTIGAVGNNGVGVVGVNWQVKIMACKFLDSSGSGYSSDAIECLQYVRAMKDNGVPLVATNNSWGGDGYSQALADAIEEQEDILFIAAAGNSALNNDLVPLYPAGYQSVRVISVAATDKADGLSSFSNYGGRSVHVAAPGSSIFSTYRGNGYTFLYGTSMAAPHVTGLAALLAAQGKDWRQARNLILTGGDALPSLDARALTGKRINAFGSLTCGDEPLFVPLWVPQALTAGTPVSIAALSVNCDAPVGPVTLTTSDGQTVPLLDDGALPDAAAGDGIFTGTLIPVSSAPQTLTFTSPAGTVTASSPPVVMADSATVDPPAILLSERNVSAPTGSSFRLAFSATGGVPPYTWSVAAGGLPAGLTMDSAAGEIAGTPTAAGIFDLTIRVADSAGMIDFRDWSLVVNEGLRAGWPKILALRTGSGALPVSYHPVFADLDKDGDDELIVADKETLYLFDDNGLVAQVTLPGQVTTPAVADLFNDGTRQIIVSVHSPATVPVYVFNKDLYMVAGFPAGFYPNYQGSAGFTGSAVVADLDNDGKPSILVVATPMNGNDANFGKNILVMVDGQGNMIDGWPKTVGSNSNLFDDRVAAVGDIDRDGRKEIVFLSNDGILQIYRKDGSEIAQWQVDDTPWGVSNPVLADFNGDGFLEIGVTTLPTRYTSKAAIFDRGGNLLPGWPQTYDGGPHVGPIAADLDGDDKAELIFPTGVYWNTWQALCADAVSLPGWPITTSYPYGAGIDTYPVVGDTDGDGVQEVFLNLSDDPTSMLAGYTASGAIVPGFPQYISPNSEVRTAPALGDLDGNGRVDIAVKSEEGVLYVWEIDQGSAPFEFQWPMFGHDTRHGNAWSVPGAEPTSLADFSASPLSGYAPLLVNFTDTSVNSPTAWAWDFGDADTSTDRNPSHLYSSSGTYTVSLTATGAAGAQTQTKTGYISVQACPDLPVRLEGAVSDTFSWIPGAYAQAADNDVIQLRGTDFSGDLEFDRDVRVTLKGGYDCGFTDNPHTTGLLGQLRVTKGTVTVSNLRFR